MNLAKAGVSILFSACMCVSSSAAVVELDGQAAVLDSLHRLSDLTRLVASNTNTIAIAVEARDSRLLPFVGLFLDLANRVAEDDALRFDTAHSIDTAVSRSVDYSISGRINELSFSTLMGKPTEGNATGLALKNPSMKYIRSVVGLNNAHHFLPQVAYPSAAGKEYSEFVNSLVAIESFSGYVLSECYADGGQQSALDLKPTRFRGRNGLRGSRQSR